MRVSYPRFFLFLLLLAVFCFASFASGATLPQDEVKALEDIAKILGKKDWDFSVDPCSKERNWTSAVQVKGSENEVRCNCDYNNGTVCHVTNIILKAQNLPGTLPQDLFRLPYLQEIDLTRNYLNGTIPKEWGSTKLLNISLLGNRLTGSIPKEIANISTLQSFVVEANQLSGDLPPELGDLPQIQRLLLSSNNFTGELPETLAKITTLQDIRIGDNQFSGKIPDFIQSLTSLQKLVIQGSGLNGPIPSGISLLKNLTDLRISDLNGSEHSPFPQLNNMTLKYLILRNCNINGTLPIYLGSMTTLKNLDLSFNKLTGPIPSNYDALRKVDYIYLTGNLLNGPVPAWTEKADNVDISYNNFSITSQGSSTCQNGNVNLFSSSTTHNDSGTVACLGSNVCQKSSYSLHINCGGKMVTEGRSTYDDDLDNGGPARFHRSGTKNWAFVTTGNFMDNDAGDYSISQNKSSLSMHNADLYMDARVSPTSLTYYGFCLGKGNYTVHLHFADIMFTNDQTFNSLGRRVFDIYIQGELVQKDFNIVEEAGGIDKAIIKNFTAVVSSNTLEIRLYWAGKGTTSLPFRSVYGPLISAISVEPNFTPPSENGSSISVGAVVGIVVAGVIVIILVLGILWWKGCLGKKSSLERELKGLDLRTGVFPLREIKVATNNFDVANKIGEGGFGPVYKGSLSDGTLIAVKQLSSKSKQGNREFLNEPGPKTEVLSIHRNTCSGAVSQARLQSFQLHARAVAKLREGNSNVKYAWYGTRGEDDVNDIVSHGFAHVHGPQLLLSPDDAPLQSVRGCVVGKDGVRHVLLCRVILGRSELVDGGTEQCYPSSQNYDSGVDSFSAPSKYIIWSNRMNTHVLPAYVISFRVPSFKGIEKKSEELLRPSSPWMPFPTLISVLSKVLASRDIALISKFYKDKKDKKISRHELIQRVRQIAGDKLLFAVIKSYREKKKQRFQHTRSKNGQATTHEF